MAKVGEGDPRWIVDERQDGRNVNSWHWEEKDITGWSKEHFKKLFTEVTFLKEPPLTLQINKVDKIDGDVVINVRKGKLLYVYDLEVSLKWKGEISDGGKSVTVAGTAEFSFNTEDNDDFELSVKSDGNANDAAEELCRSAVRSNGLAFLRERVLQFVKDLRELNPYANSLANRPGGSSTALTPKVPAPAAAASSVTSSAMKPGVSIRTLNLKVEVNAPPREVQDTLLDQGKLSAITQSAAVIAREAGSKFSMFNGSITGEIVSVAPNQIVQKWRSNSWPAGHHSVVTFQLDASHNGTLVTMRQEGVPVDDFDRTEHGWKQLFWDRFRMLYGSVDIQ